MNRFKESSQARAGEKHAESDVAPDRSASTLRRSHEIVDPIQVSSTLQGLIGNRAVEQMTTKAAPRATTAAGRLAVARSGLAGTPQVLPHRTEMETLFGMPLGHLRAYTDEGAARSNTALGAEAYALGDDLAFGTANPARPLVAHEVTHALREGRGDSASEAREESIAEAAEGRAQGAITSRAMNPAFISSAPRTRSEAPRLLCKPAPATPGRISTVASSTGLEQAFEYAFSRPFPSVPIPGTPLRGQIIPELRLSARIGGVHGGEGAGTSVFRGLASGRVILLVFLGAPAVAEIFASATPAVDVNFAFRNYGNTEVASPAASTPWALDLPSVAIRGSLRLGTRLGRRSTEYGYELISGDLVKLELVRITPQGIEVGRIIWNQTVVDALVSAADSTGKAWKAVERGATETLSPPQRDQERTEGDDLRRAREEQRQDFLKKIPVLGGMLAH